MLVRIQASCRGVSAFVLDSLVLAVENIYQKRYVALVPVFAAAVWFGSFAGQLEAGVVLVCCCVLLPP